MEVILYSKECNWYTRCCLLNGGVRYRECPLREAILYYPSSYCFYCILIILLFFNSLETGFRTSPEYIFGRVS